MDAEKKCNLCGLIKPITDFYIDNRWGTPRSECKNCLSIRHKKTYRGIKIDSGKSNKSCSQYLGVHVAEKVLSLVFTNVERMPLKNHGYDFICGKGYKIEVKSACLKADSPQWMFRINKNNVADYFALLAFDNRNSLNPLHFWLVPSVVLKDCNSLTISRRNILKFKEYEKPTDKIIQCCNILKT